MFEAKQSVHLAAKDFPQLNRLSSTSRKFKVIRLVPGENAKKVLKVEHLDDA
jgi:hypothetical protein